MSDLSNIDMRDAFFDAVYDEATQNPNVYFLSDDHGAFSLERFQKDFPERYINIGIAEQNMIGVSSGLSLSGKIVYCYGISPFVSLKVLEQISLDLATIGSNVNIVSVGAGFTYATDGPSHHGLQDLSAVLSTPNITILNSSDPKSTQAFAKMAIEVSGKKLGIHNIDGQDFIDKYGHKCPIGVNGRNSDNTLYHEKIGWKVSQPLIEGMRKTYEWINSQSQKA